MKYITLIFGCLFASNSFSSESYLCTPSVVTGIYQDQKDKKLKTGKFKPEPLILKPLVEKDLKSDLTYGVYSVKNNSLLFSCQYWFPDVGIAHCGNGNEYHFKFIRNENGGKFMMADLSIGYLIHYKSEVTRIGAGDCIQLD